MRQQSRYTRTILVQRTPSRSNVGVYIVRRVTKTDVFPTSCPERYPGHSATDPPTGMWSFVIHASPSVVIPHALPPDLASYISHHSSCSHIETRSSSHQTLTATHYLGYNFLSFPSLSAGLPRCVVRRGHVHDLVFGFTLLSRPIAFFFLITFSRGGSMNNLIYPFLRSAVMMSCFVVHHRHLYRLRRIWTGSGRFRIIA